jgi:hypothetical protein
MSEGVVTVRRIVAVLVSAAIAAAVATTVATARSDGMYAIQITGYKVNSDKTVTIKVKVRGLKLAPAKVGKASVAGQGHWHIYVNKKYNNFSASPTSGKTKKLKKGDYKVYVELVNNDHSPLSERTVSKTIPVMVGV